MVVWSHAAWLALLEPFTLSSHSILAALGPSLGIFRLSMALIRCLGSLVGTEDLLYLLTVIRVSSILAFSDQ